MILNEFVNNALYVLIHQEDDNRPHDNSDPNDPPNNIYSFINQTGSNHLININKLFKILEIEKNVYLESMLIAFKADINNYYNSKTYVHKIEKWIREFNYYFVSIQSDEIINIYVPRLHTIPFE